MNDQEIKKDDEQESLADLELADEQTDTTKAGNGNLQISQFYFGSTQPSVR